MKRIKLIALALLICIFIVPVCTSCVMIGNDGLSAYEIAVKNGFKGSEKEWLDSLKGETVYVSSSDSSGSNAPDTDTNGDTVINQTINQNTITITGSSTDVAYAASAGLRSAVSVWSTFTAYTGKGSTTEKYYSAGSGVIYKLEDGGADAFIITNYHVVYDSASITSNGISDSITLYLYGMELEGYEIEATYVGGSMNYDIAVLRVENSSVLKSAYEAGSVCEATFADSDEIMIGQTAIAIGNPEAEGFSVTSGIVSVDSEHITMTGADGTTSVTLRVIRTDTAVNSGNSGGGLFDANGELIGIVNAKIASSDVENIGYAIPSNVAKAVADNIIYYCYNSSCETVMRALLGITVQIVEMSTEYNTETGALIKHDVSQVVQITSGSLADGLFEVGDVVKSMKIGDNEIEITRQHHIIDAMLTARAGDVITVTVSRNVNGVATDITETVTVTSDNITAYK